ncbi:hypothetical protein B7W85_22475 [Allorhizobium ampelinum]|nr:hypothetical protein BBL07_19785 [Agrobacterium vitis]OVE89458.1 hypothetical protein B7W85_22475 [Allorhizobium ampelinum]BCH68031.1 hypothetical protein RvVAT039_pl08640 [Agrobacterium vitis]
MTANLTSQSKRADEIRRIEATLKQLGEAVERNGMSGDMLDLILYYTLRLADLKDEARRASG